MSIVRPTLLALDSSHLGKLADNARSLHTSQRNTAAAFLRSLSENSRIILLSWHHFEEVLSHDNSDVVKDRIAFFQSLPSVAWIASVQGNDVPGSIIDVSAFEVAEAFSQPRARAIEIRDRVAQELFNYGTGRQAIEPFIVLLREVPEEFRRRKERTREIVAIAHSTYLDLKKTKVKDWLNGRVRPFRETEERLANMTRLLADDIRQRGDKRISDSETAAKRFIDDIQTTGQKALTGTKKPSPSALLPEEIDPSEIGPETTLEDIGELAAFRRKLRLVNDYLGLPWPDVKATVTEERIPSGIIQTALRRYRQDHPERKGSELIDRYLACLAPYADVTYVDRRTHEVVTRARRGSVEFANLIKRIEKAGVYTEAAA
jgi:hypothetical protein